MMDINIDILSLVGTNYTFCAIDRRKSTERLCHKTTIMATIMAAGTILIASCPLRATSYVQEPTRRHRLIEPRPRSLINKNVSFKGIFATKESETNKLLK